MLHLVWMILRVILILLLAILGILCLILLMLLFVPFTYGGSVSKSREQTFGQVQAKGRFSWLFHGISLCVLFQDGKPEILLRILGIPVKHFGSSGKKKQKKKKDYSAKRKPQKVTAPKAVEQEQNRPNASMSEETENSAFHEDSKERKLPQKDFTEASVSEPLVTGSSVQKEFLTEPDQTEESKKLSFFEKLQRIWKQLCSLPKKAGKAWESLQQTMERIGNKIHRASENLSWWRELLENNHTRNAVSLLLTKGKHLLRHILPRKVQGQVTFGLEDPSMTGTVLGVLGMTMPIHKNRIQITPLFDGENSLDMQVAFRGRIYVAVVLVTVLQVYFNKNTKFVIRKWKHKEV